MSKGLIIGFVLLSFCHPFSIRLLSFCDPIPLLSFCHTFWVFTSSLYVAFPSVPVFVRRTARWRIGYPEIWQSFKEWQHLKEKILTPCITDSIVCRRNSTGGGGLNRLDIETCTFFYSFLKTFRQFVGGGGVVCLYFAPMYDDSRLAERLYGPWITCFLHPIRGSAQHPFCSLLLFFSTFRYTTYILLRRPSDHRFPSP